VEVVCILTSLPTLFDTENERAWDKE
jgi:hypothetical protein